jgi:4-amino-4-deoxy-L-arabinose transferase-like glycosyltransferase
LILAAHAAISVGHSLAVRPWSDEGAMASPAYDLLTRGSTGTMSWDEALWPGIHTHTYYIMPSYILALAGWFRITGVGLLQMRLFSLLWAFLALLACYVLARRLSLGKGWALVAMALTACDYMFLQSSSFGRMDTMSAALGFGSLAVFLSLRERHFAVALGAAAALNAAAVFTHPIAITHFCALVFLVFYFDRRSLSWRLVLLAAIPFALATAAWGLYIMRSPSDFVAQFTLNANYGGRLSSIKSPVTALKREILVRYGMAYGLGAHSAGNTGPIFLKALALAAYVIGVIGCFVLTPIRKNPRYRVILVLVPLYVLVMGLIDGTKNPYYLLHVTPLLAISLTIFASEVVQSRMRLRWLVAAGLTGVALLQAGGMLYKAHLNSYRNRYAPMVRFLAGNIVPRSIIAGSSAMTFDFGFDGRNLIDDARLGYVSHTKPDFVVVDEIYADVFEGHIKHRPAVAKYVQQLLQTEYRPVYDQGQIIVYQRIGADVAARRPLDPL